jgi:hypothetical protein
MTYDEDKVDEMVLALLYLTLHPNGRAWKGMIGMPWTAFIRRE